MGNGGIVKLLYKIAAVTVCFVGLGLFVVKTEIVAMQNIGRSLGNGFNIVKQGTQEYVVNPTTGVVLGSKESIEAIIHMVHAIQGLIGGVNESVVSIIAQVNALTHSKNGQELIDPSFNILKALTQLPVHVQSILSEVAACIHGFETIVRPFKASDADKMKHVTDAVAMSGTAVKDVTKKIEQLNEKLRIHAKKIGASADQTVHDLLAVIKTDKGA